MISTVLPHRVPSPRGLVMNTQTIMQNALIKKKLEEQRENFRKRQEQQQQQQQHKQHQQHQQQQQQQMTSPVNAPTNKTLSPTPLAFTPTSVLRKMTAEKELEGAKTNDRQVELFISSPASRNAANSPALIPQRFCQSHKLIITTPKIINLVDKDSSRVRDDFNNNANRVTNLKLDVAALKLMIIKSVENNKDGNNNSNLAAISYNNEKSSSSDINKCCDDSDTNNNDAIVGKNLTVNVIPANPKVIVDGDENSMNFSAVSDERFIAERNDGYVEINGSI